ncbi:DUF2304 domain-containing protein [Actinokineospora auranticolor]|uniref:DUF2304 domain-containing protein n=1 Tax=Actinokineospora auranticolor TaxID=155976 RepID=A0A2S6GL41_9PSEU|nr:DUF2304 domain-containing protein [Actinokineospora auranticolor]PPK65952.1 hypothetical protein CLV40_112220 [Actinokineospora auranticolor]
MAGWRILSIVVAGLVLLFVFEMLRRRKLREKYAGMWLLVGLGVVVFGVFPGSAEGLARLVGVQTGSNLVFFLAGAVLGVVCLHLSSEVGHLEEETRTAVEEIALLRCELERTRAELEARVAALETGAQAGAGSNGQLVSHPRG